MSHRLNLRFVSVPAITAASVALSSLAITSDATAQVDVNRPLPNVLLLVDTSGSMEYLTDGTDVPSDYCDATQPAGNLGGNAMAEMNRWGTLLTVLTGTFDGVGCYRYDRSSAEYRNQFGLGGNDPYDASYILPYHHRYLSNGCMPMPGAYDIANVFSWEPDYIEYRPWNNVATTCPAGTFRQSIDGLLDTYRDRVRFGLFTFDPHTDEGTGLTGGSAWNATTGIEGMWSYHQNWRTGSANAADGHPPDCSDQMHEVGARNAAAPPWEGRMVPFGSPNATIDDIRLTNEHIQQVLLATRPYGATPLAGMLSDAQHFFTADTDTDLNTGEPFAPYQDDYFQDGCRESYIIVLTDGEPNLELRPYCEMLGSTINGDCPYDNPEEIVQQLALMTPSVKTFVVGFGIADSANCNTMNIPTDISPGGLCDAPSTPTEATCCELQKIAFAGGTGERAFFADDTVSLRSSISNVLDSIADETTSRTLPVFASATATLAGSSNAEAVAYEFNTSFTPEPGELWQGEIERKRWRCEVVAPAGLQPVLQDVDAARGDDFADNLQSAPMSNSRTFYTVYGDYDGSDIHSDWTIRMDTSISDGLGTYSGTVETGDDAATAGFAGSKPEAMNMGTMPTECSNQDLNATTNVDCANKVMYWLLGGDNGGGRPVRKTMLGAIYHSTPVVVDAPRAFVRDEAYDFFAANNATRPLMLYTATVDGLLHAFKVARNDTADPNPVDNLANNELWSFIPPAVMPRILSQYPGSQQILLDGRPFVRDIPFERTVGQAAAAGTAGGADYHTVLVAGGYLGGGFYYALDVTDPENPEFLWQLATDDTGARLFGDISGNPTITSLVLQDGTDVKEVAVAILPGGSGTIVSNTCADVPRQDTNFVHIDSSYPPRPSVNCWTNGPPRSLTIVRLDTGEILRTFRGALSDGPASINSLATVVPFDAPIVGTPVPYPFNTGQVSNRAYIGDADGTLWRVDLSSPDPTQWQVDIAFDAYLNTTDGAKDGQPIATTPTLSVDEQGNAVILFSTGDQESFDSTAVKGRVYSLTELPIPAGGRDFTIDVNWVLSDTNGDFQPGEKVTGPITLFDGAAYFSTFTPPPPTESCDVGSGRVWGVDYRVPDTATTGPRPMPRFPDTPSTFKYYEDLGTNVTPFGVAVTAEPPCIETNSTTDDFVGQHRQVTTSIPPTYKLRFQTGSTGTKDAGSVTNVGQVALPTPRTTTYIDSWASVVE